MTGTTREPGESGTGAGEQSPAEQLWCAVCGRAPRDDADRLGWSYSVERGRAVWTCPQCARRHARSIEGKLDSEWW